MLPRYQATRYVLPLREGGSLPAIVDTDEPGQFVVKFRGAGQGPKALVAEIIAAGIARTLGLNVPDAALVTLAEGFGLGEPNPEIQGLLRFSTGLNFGLRYLPGALGFEPAADARHVDPALAGDIVWLDAYITNVDRTPNNPNLLVWEDKLWLIDHGASLYFHHATGVDWQARSQDAFPLIKNHVLLSRASDLEDADTRLRPLLADDVLRRTVADVPAELLDSEPESQREAYVAYLSARLNGKRAWLQEAQRARRG